MVQSRRKKVSKSEHRKRPVKPPTEIEARRNELEPQVRCELCRKPFRSPLLCPTCYIPACEKCFSKWINGTSRSGSVANQNCFKCNVPLEVQQLKKCPWLEMFAAEMLTLQLRILNEKRMIKKRYKKGISVNPPAIPREDVEAIMGTGQERQITLAEHVESNESPNNISE